MAQGDSKNSVNRKTIQSQTTKVFLVVFVILLTVGLFTVFSTYRGYNTFHSIESIYVKQFQAMATMKHRGLEVIGIFYLASGDHNLDIQLAQIQRYDALVKKFEESHQNMIKRVNLVPNKPQKARMLAQSEEVKTSFEKMNSLARTMTFAILEGRAKDAKKNFTSVDSSIEQFKTSVDKLEQTVTEQLNTETNAAQNLLSITSIMGVILALSAIFVSLGLIYYLMKFLSVSLLPISNLMNNMRQAVFSINEDLEVVTPVSNYSETVFGQNILDKNILDLIYDKLDRESEEAAALEISLTSAFDRDEMQWMLIEDNLPPQAKLGEKTIKLTYTPLYGKDDLCRSIMIVAEDISEVVELQLLAQEQQGENEVVLSMVEHDRSDLEMFLNKSWKIFSEIKQHAQKDGDLGSVFRALHTLKGNASMYNLNLVSKSAHEAENHLEKMREAVSDDKQFIILAEKVEQLEGELLRHLEIAKKIFSIDVSGTDSSIGDSDSVQIPKSRFELFKTLANQLTGTDETSQSLKIAIAGAFDIPIKSICRKLKPLVTNVSNRLEKKVNFSVTGDDVFVPREQASIIQDAMVHLIRNSIDHGFESTELRKKLGKSEDGQLTVECHDQINSIEIVVKDDGKGIDDQKVIEKAITSRKITEDEAKQLSKQERVNLIFLPNLSTKEVVSEISGRGVGMDAVKGVLEELGASISCRSELNEGSEFTITLPKDSNQTKLAS